MPNNQAVDAGPQNLLAAWATVGLLSMCYMFSFLDRQILVLLIEPIKSDLSLSDTEVSLLSGLAFGLVYAVMGLPMGRLADLWVRKYVLIIGVTIWSSMTLVAGLANTFLQLFVARMGVGFGEAALTPTAYAIIGDSFPPKRMALAMSVFAFGGLAVGLGMSLVVGGVVIHWVEALGPFRLPIFGTVAAWQMVLIVVGLASLLMVIPLGLMREPPRRKRVTGAPMTFAQVLQYVVSNRDFYALLLVGMCCSAFFTYGVGGWIPTYFIRIRGWEASSTGMTLGGIYILAASIGSIGSGALSDRLTAKGYRAAPLAIMALMAAAGAVLVLPMIYTEHEVGQLIALGGVYFCIGINSVLFPTVLVLATRSDIRAQVSAINLLVLNLAGGILGPMMVAVVTDYWFVDEMRLGDSIAITGVGSLLICAASLYAVLPAFVRRLEAHDSIADPASRSVTASVVPTAERAS